MDTRFELHLNLSLRAECRFCIGYLLEDASISREINSASGTAVTL